MKFVGANPRARVAGEGALPGKVNYFIGNDPARWHTGVSTFNRVRVEEIYPGVNLVYYGNEQRLEYDLVVAPQADPAAIAIHFDGPEKVRVDARGDLVLSLGQDEILQPKPTIYQDIAGTRKEIPGGYQLTDKQTVTFKIGHYDRTLPLIIDPVLSYSTFFGGSGSDTAWGVAVDTNGFVYVAGETTSTLLATDGAFQTNLAGVNLFGDAFVAKFDNTASHLIYLTYLGGRADDFALALALDGSGNAYLTGYTDSPDFPVKSAIYTNISGSPFPELALFPLDGFVAKLDASGSNLVYSTYLGGSDRDLGMGIAVDAAGNACVVGYTESTNFPTVSGLFTNYGGLGDAFAAKINAAGTALIYSTYLGGTNQDVAYDVATDAAGLAYVTGYTRSTNFPSFRAPQPALVDAQDAFVTVIGTNGTNLVFSSYLGGSGTDVGYGIALDAASNFYVTGSIREDPNFPITPSALNPGGVFRSDDSAATWNEANAGLFSIVVPALAVDPVTPTRLYAGTWRGIARSDDGGAHWTSAIAVAPTSDGLAPAIAAGAVLALAIDPVTPATIYAATASHGVFTSLNAGTNWSLSSTDLVAATINSLAIDPLTPTTIYAGGDAGIFKSTNAAATWNAASSGLDNTLVRALAVHPVTPATVYAATAGGVYRSTNSGVTWAAFNSGLTNLSAQAIAIDPATPATLYAGTTGGVFKSTDSATNWSAINAGLTSSDVTALAVDRLNPMTVYAGTTDGLFKSTDGGATWSPNTNGLSVQRVLALAVNPQVPATLYAGTAGAAFFGGKDVFVFKSGTNAFSAVFGGSQDDEGSDVALDSAAHAHVLGTTASTDFPTYASSGFLRATNSGGTDAFVAELGSNGTALVHSAYLGGTGEDFGHGIKLDDIGNTYLVGETTSTDFPTVRARQAALGGGKDAFLAKIGVPPTLSASRSDTNIVLSWRAPAPEFRLITKQSLADFFWFYVSAPPVLTNGWHTVTLGATNDASFFELYLP